MAPTHRSIAVDHRTRPTVAHIASRYYALTENWIHTQVKHLTRYRPLVLTWQTENLESGWVPDYYALLERPKLETLTNQACRRLLGYYPSFRWLLRRSGARVIHAHYGFRGYYAVPLAEATGLPLVTTFYGYDLSRLPQMNRVWRGRYQHLFERGHRFLAEGPHMARQLRDLGCPVERITVQHLGIELDAFPFRPRYLAVDEPLCILAAARFTEKKGLVYAVQAFASLTRQGINSRLTIIGDAGQGKEQQATKRLILAAIEDNHLTDRVTLRGIQPNAELKKAYYEHHVFLSPSVQASDGDNEGGAPVTLMEASATGMPIVATNHCDIPEVVLDGSTGLLAPERDSEVLANQLQSFVEYPHRLEEMGSAGRKHIEAEYDSRTQGQRLDEIYDEIVAEGNPD